jgi:hypothetical protein
MAYQLRPARSHGHEVISTDRCKDIPEDIMWSRYCSCEQTDVFSVIVIRDLVDAGVITNEESFIDMQAFIDMEG